MEPNASPAAKATKWGCLIYCAVLAAIPFAYWWASDPARLGDFAIARVEWRDFSGAPLQVTADLPIGMRRQLWTRSMLWLTCNEQGEVRIILRTLIPYFSEQRFRLRPPKADAGTIIISDGPRDFSLRRQILVEMVLTEADVVDTIVSAPLAAKDIAPLASMDEGSTMFVAFDETGTRLNSMVTGDDIRAFVAQCN